MKGLNQFVSFDATEFFKGKELMVTSVSPLVDFDTKNEVGMKVEITIVADNTAYHTGKDGAEVSNLFEKFTVKLLNRHTVGVKVKDLVRIINPKTSVWGQFRNQLSVTAEDVINVKTQEKI